MQVCLSLWSQWLSYWQRKGLMVLWFWCFGEIQSRSRNHWWGCHCQSSLHVEGSALPQETGSAAAVRLPRWGVGSLHLKLSILVAWGIHWEWTLPFQKLVRMLVFSSQFWEKCEVSLNGNYNDLSTARESSFQSFLSLQTRPLPGDSSDRKDKAAF